MYSCTFRLIAMRCSNDSDTALSPRSEGGNLASFHIQRACQPRRKSENIAEYLQEESRDLPARAEIDEFLEGVDRVREAIDRIEARIGALERRAAGGS